MAGQVLSLVCGKETTSAILFKITFRYHCTTRLSYRCYHFDHFTFIQHGWPITNIFYDASTPCIFKKKGPISHQESTEGTILAWVSLLD
jgi:hypothetical protein